MFIVVTVENSIHGKRITTFVLTALAWTRRTSRMPTDFGRKARAYRLRHDMLLYDMAQIMRLGTAQFSGYECGREDPPADVVASLDTLIRVEK